MLVTMKEILDRASAENYAVAAPNVHSEMNARAYIEAAEEVNAPIIIDINFKSHPDVPFLSNVVRELARQSCVPVAINLDHGAEKWKILTAMRGGFTSVMIDRSTLPFEENVAQVKEIVEIAHSIGLTVEAELGHVGFAQQYEQDRDSALTSVDEAVEFVKLTGVDCLAVAIGTAHGAYPKGFKPYLDFDRLEQIKNAVKIPLVLHGSSGTDEDDLRKACSMGINKVNIAYDLARAASDTVQGADLSGQNAYQFWNLIKEGPKEKLKYMIGVYGSAGKAWTPVSYSGLVVQKTGFLDEG